ncbi:MAG: hypothetical protein ABSE57_33980 [Bryobacteraceae bacterium]
MGATERLEDGHYSYVFEGRDFTGHFGEFQFSNKIGQNYRSQAVWLRFGFQADDSGNRLKLRDGRRQKPQMIGRRPQRHFAPLDRAQLEQIVTD